MDRNKEKQEISIIGRIFSLEALILVMGVASLIYGIVKLQAINIFWGIAILGGFTALILVRKKDWKKHWEDLEKEKEKREGKR